MNQILTRRSPRKPNIKSLDAWDDRKVNELLAWAEHSRRRGAGASAKYFESTVVSHLRHIFQIQFSLAKIDEKLKELARDADRPLSSVHHSKLYTGDGLSSMARCVVRNRDALKILMARVAELDANPQSTPRSYGKSPHSLATKENQERSSNPGVAQQRLKDITDLYKGYKQNHPLSTKRRRRRRNAKFKKVCSLDEVISHH